MGLYIPHDKLKNLRLYKYASEDHSLISKYVLKRWWNLFVKVFPMNMAPNVITLMGLGFVLANLAAVAYYDPKLNQDSPRWCYFFYAFGLFMYQTFDGCDGCHARRTGQSGPLGELFDHSIDAINTTLAAIVLASVFQLGFGWLLFFCQFAAVCNFYSSTWEEYHTHKLYLSVFSGPVEGVLIMVGVYLVTGFFGPDIWKYTLFTLDLTSFGYPPMDINGVQLASAWGLGQLYFNIVLAQANVAKHYREDKSLSPKETEERIQDANLGLIPFFVNYACYGIFVFCFPEIVSDQGFPLMISIGLSVAFCVGRIILAHLTLQDFPYFQVTAVIPLLQVVAAKVLIGSYGYGRSSTLSALMWLGAGINFGIHATFVAEIITEITGYLDIYALFIKHKKA